MTDAVWMAGRHRFGGEWDFRPALRAGPKRCGGLTAFPPHYIFAGRDDHRAWLRAGAAAQAEACGYEGRNVLAAGVVWGHVGYVWKRRGVRLTVLLAVAVGGWGWLYLRPLAREPMHAGKPLAYWLEGFKSPPPSGRSMKEAEAAVREAGTNALPTLLSLLRARDTRFTLAWLALAQKQHYFKVEHVPALERNFEAQAAFRILGAGASNVVPALIGILEEKRSADSEIFTIYALAHVGPPAAVAVPALLESATNSVAAVRYNSLWALGCIKAEPEHSVPALIRGLSDPDGNARVAAVDALGNFGPAARPAVPALKAAAGDAQVNLRDSVGEALKKIDPEAGSIKN